MNAKVIAALTITIALALATPAFAQPAETQPVTRADLGWAYFRLEKALQDAEPDAELGARGKGRGDAGNDFHANALLFQKIQLFLRAAKKHRVAALETHDGAVAPRRVGEALVDELLRGGELPTALSDRDFQSKNQI